MSTRTRGAVVSVLAAVALLLAGCGKDPVTIPPVRVDAAGLKACRDFAAALPKTVADQTERLTQPAAALGGAWGDPPIVARCGVTYPPAGFGKGSTCQLADGLAWYVPDDQVEDPSLDVTMTTIGYEPAVEVDVPADYRPDGQAAAMIEVGRAVRSALKQVGHC